MDSVLFLLCMAAGTQHLPPSPFPPPLKFCTPSILFLWRNEHESFFKANEKEKFAFFRSLEWRLERLWWYGRKWKRKKGKCAHAIEVWVRNCFSLTADVQVLLLLYNRSYRDMRIHIHVYTEHTRCCIALEGYFRFCIILYVKFVCTCVSVCAVGNAQFSSG